MDESYCFACGKNNPIGLKLEFHTEENVARGTFLPRREHQGYDGVVHGGILATLADESMAQLLIAHEIEAVTATLEMKYKRPALVEEVLQIEARIDGSKGKIHRLATSIVNANGLVVAEAQAVFIKVVR